MNFILVQIIGIIGYIGLAISYYQTKKKNILLIQIFSCLVFAIHFYFLDGITGTICNLINMTSMIIIYLFDKQKKYDNKILILGIIPFLILISLITYQNIFSIFPIIASTIVLLGFLTSNENLIRVTGIISAISWLIYALVYKSYGSIVFETLTILTTIFALYKNIRKK